MKNIIVIIKIQLLGFLCFLTLQFVFPVGGQGDASMEGEKGASVLLESESRKRKREELEQPLTPETPKEERCFSEGVSLPAWCSEFGISSELYAAMFTAIKEQTSSSQEKLDSSQRLKLFFDFLKGLSYNKIKKEYSLAEVFQYNSKAYTVYCYIIADKSIKSYLSDLFSENRQCKLQFDYLEDWAQKSRKYRRQMPDYVKKFLNITEPRKRAKTCDVHCSADDKVTSVPWRDKCVSPPSASTSVLPSSVYQEMASLLYGPKVRAGHLGYGEKMYVDVSPSVFVEDSEYPQWCIVFGITPAMYGDMLGALDGLGLPSEVARYFRLQSCCSNNKCRRFSFEEQMGMLFKWMNSVSCGQVAREGNYSSDGVVSRSAFKACCILLCDPIAQQVLKGHRKDVDRTVMKWFKTQRKGNTTVYKERIKPFIGMLFARCSEEPSISVPRSLKRIFKACGHSKRRKEEKVSFGKDVAGATASSSSSERKGKPVCEELEEVTID